MNLVQVNLVATISVFLFFHGAISTFDVPEDPIPQNEWEPNLDIFRTWPKEGLEEINGKLKSPPVSIIHKYLPGDMKPSEYVIKIRIILESPNEHEELTAPGTVSIKTKCLNPTEIIWMHADTNYVDILTDTVKVSETLLSKPISLPVVNHTFDPETAFYGIHLARPCKRNLEYMIEISFVAKIANDTLTGLYLSTYTDPNTNITKRVATTQFEAEHARQMFPHFDDPDYKATFQLIIGRYYLYNSLSNMNLVKTEANKEIPGWLWDHYAPTPVMSSYLNALIVSQFTCVASKGFTKHVEVCGPPYMIAKGGGDHSADAVAKILTFYDKFMLQKYPLPKMTSAAIPDFQAGAMENFGLNTYRIKGLIYYKGITSEEAKYRIDLTIAHELAHQNWGNLVTCKLWNQIWLNEGFATYISYFGISSASPEFDPSTQWLTGYRRRALQMDGSVNTHPLVNISSPMFYFDGISYSKGASLLKMMEKFLTRKVFHEALQFYLAKFKYGTATQWDLFDVIDRHAVFSGVQPTVASVTEIMETWSLQSGYPIIRVEYISDRAIALSQERFIDEPSDEKIDKPPTYWYVPITTQGSQSVPSLVDEVPSTWLTPLEPTQVLYLGYQFSWIVVNPEASVYARVIYDDILTKRIQELMLRSHDAISPVTRAQIIEDAFEVAWSGAGRIEDALELTKYLYKEQEPVVWTVALNGLGRIYSMLVEDEEAIQLFKNYVFQRVASSLALTGFVQPPDEKGTKVIHRSTMLNWAGMLEVPEALQYATQTVRSWIETSVNEVPADLHSQTYCNAVIGGTRDIYDGLVDLLIKETDDDLQQALGKSLGCSKTLSVLEELRRNLTVEDFGISQSLSHEIIVKLARNTASRKSMLPYFEEKFDEIKEYFEGVKIIGRSFQAAAQYWNTLEHLQQVKDFIAKYKDELADIQRSLKRVILQIERNIVWMERYSQPIKIWLTENQ